MSPRAKERRSPLGPGRTASVSFVGAVLLALAGCANGSPSAEPTLEVKITAVPAPPSGSATSSPAPRQAGLPVAPNRYERHLIRVGRRPGITDLSSPEDQVFSARMEGHSRDRAVLLAYFNDPAHSGGGRFVREGTAGGQPVRELAPSVAPRYLTIDCGDDHYEVSVARAGDLHPGRTIDEARTRMLMARLAEESGCSAQ